MREHLLPPTNCDNCNSDRVGLTSNAVLYGQEKGAWPYCYYCDDCRAMVNCHPNTYSPLGLMATGATRRKRLRLHILFDPVWQNKYLTRDEAYEWLGNELGVQGQCHIGNLTKDQLLAAIAIVNAHSANNYAMFKRRKKKDDERRTARQQRENNQIGRRKSQ